MVGCGAIKGYRKGGKIKTRDTNIFHYKSIFEYFTLIVAIFGPWILSFTNLPSWVAPFITFVLGYLITMIFYFPKLTEFNSEHFHLGAYKTWRKQEYDLFRGAFLDFTSSKEGYQMIQSLISDFIGQERTEYKARIYSLEQSIEQNLSNTERITAESRDLYSGFNFRKG